MRSPSLLIFIAFVLAGLASVAVAVLTAGWIESRSRADVTRALVADGHVWAEIDVDGLLLTLSGLAPTEADRFRALTAAGAVMDPTRVIDAMEVAAAEAIEPPRFSIEMLRNAAGVSLIGLVPAATDRTAVVDGLEALPGVPRVTDMLEAAEHPAPEGWDPALDFALAALRDLPRSKISVAADRVEITAISDSPAEKRRIETDLVRQAPDGVTLALDISAPRPVITPFTLRFLIDADGPRFDACSAGTEAGRDRIIEAALATGLQGRIDCPVGLGAPSPDWAAAAATALTALAEIGQGSVTFSDADVTLIADASTDPDVFDRVVVELDAALPEVFALEATRIEAPAADGEPGATAVTEFTATRDSDGQVQLRGRLADDRTRAAVESYAAARFGQDQVSSATRLDPDLPSGWALRVLAGLEAFAELNSGSLTVRPDTIALRGVTGNTGARADIARILAEKLGGQGEFTIDVTYEEALDPVAALPTPEDCVARINAALAARQITFAPGSSDIDPAANDTLDRIAEIMEECRDVAMEVGGHTDSQGRESMNEALSKSRAEAVVLALQARRVLTGNLTTRGYGEAQPIADNDTEAGREANRRIEFQLVLPEAEAPEATAEGGDEQN